MYTHFENIGQLSADIDWNETFVLLRKGSTFNAFCSPIIPLEDYHPKAHRANRRLFTESSNEKVNTS